MKKLICLFGFSVAGVGIEVHAQHEYDFIEARVEYIELDNLDSLGDPQTLTGYTYQLGASYDLNNDVVLVASIEQTDFDESLGFSNQQRIVSIGAGYHYPILADADVYGYVSYASIDTDLDSGSEDDQGVLALIGVRVFTSQRWEFTGAIEYAGIEDPLQETDSEVSIKGDTRWHFAERMSVSVGAAYGEDRLSVSVNFRFSMDGIRVF
ncbi:MAG: hypothetical protein AAF438_20840 [Pseudomonadota bacterium]